jgi:hypothetical protein
LHPEKKQKMTDKPTAERILKAFSDVSLTIIKNAAGEEILRAAQCARLGVEAEIDQDVVVEVHETVEVRVAIPGVLHQCVGRCGGVAAKCRPSAID